MAASNLLSRAAGGLMKLAREHAHPRDARITFVEEGHAYYVDGKRVSTSVTGVLEGVSANKFDGRSALAKMKSGSNWPRREYADEVGGALVPWSDDRILQRWSDNGRNASELGTDMHGRIERYLNGEPVTLVDGDTNTVEFSMFLHWWEERKRQGYRPYRTEWVIFDEEADVAGSVDFVMYKPETGRVTLVDWKRCETCKPGFSNAFGRKLKPPLGHVADCTSSKWQLQINVYREILETLYGLEVEGMAMVVCHGSNEQALEFPFDRSSDARRLLNERRRAAGAPLRPVSPVLGAMEKDETSHTSPHVASHDALADICGIPVVRYR